MQDNMILCIVICALISTACCTQIRIVTSGHCDTSKHYVVMLHLTNKENRADGSQIFDGNLTFDRDVGDDTFIRAKVERIAGDKWMRVFENENRKGVCKFFTGALGPLWPKLQGVFGMSENQCPLKKGFYHMENAKLKADLPLPRMLVLGRMRITAAVFDKSSSEELSCYMATIDTV